MNRAKFVKEVTVIDPDTEGEVKISIFKHENGGMFGIDSSYIDQVLPDIDEQPEVYVPDPLHDVSGIIDYGDYYPLVILEGV